MRACSATPSKLSPWTTTGALAPFGRRAVATDLVFVQWGSVPARDKTLARARKAIESSRSRDGRRRSCGRVRSLGRCRTRHERADDLGEVIGDLTDLARDEVPDEAHESDRLDKLARRSLERARRHDPGLEVTREVSGYTVEVPRAARALNNPLDKPSDTPAKPGRCADRAGPARSPHRPRPRARRRHRPQPPLRPLPPAAARAGGRPGSGLGPAIVRQVAPPTAAPSPPPTRRAEGRCSSCGFREKAERAQARRQD